MPTYEYRCGKCRKKHEAFQTITAKALTKCPRPKCGGRLTRLLGGGSGFLFKGSGFYITDYRSKNYQDAKKKDQPAPPKKTETPSSGTSGTSTGKGARGGAS